VPGVSRIRAVLGGSVGNLVEWFDWYTYSAPRSISPRSSSEGDQTAQLLQTAACSAVGFFARPVGAWLMGLYADRVGARPRSRCRHHDVRGIAGNRGDARAATIGVAAPVILLLARISRACPGGEYGASAPISVKWRDASIAASGPASST